MPDRSRHFGLTQAPPYTLSGTITNQQGQPLSGVTVTLSGAESDSTTTNGSGQFSLPKLENGNYTLTPSLAGHVFNPASITYNDLQKNWSNANFTALPAQQTTFEKRVNYAYNTVGALSGVGTNLLGSDPNNTTNVINGLSFKAFGAIKQLNYGNGLQLTMGYNANRQQPISMKVGPNGTGTILDYSYEYYDAQGHNNNRIRSITDATDGAYSVNYTYDQWNRLTHATAGAYARYYTYDAFGNLKTVTGSGGPQPNYTLNYAQNATTAPATNRILSVTENGATQGFTYDNAGNLTSGDGMTYAYDAANRLKEVNAGALGQYGYDGDGARVKKVEGGLTTHYVRSNKFGRVAFEVGQASLQRVYVYSGSGKLLAEQAPDGQIYWLHTSHLNSTRAMTDSSGNLSYKGQFDPHGQMLMEWSATGNPNLNTLKFTGYERDVATGLDYAEARTYKGNRGRFVQADPKGMEAASQSQPESLNRYSYVHNDPVNYVDPGGTDAIIWECVLLRKWFDGSNGQEIWWGLFSCTSYRELSARDPYGKSGGGGEQGGRGGGASNTDNGTKEEKRQRAINKAFEALYNRPECNDLISGRSGVASALLSVLSDRGQFTEQDDPLFHNSRSANVPALTQGQGDLAKIKLRPPIDDSDSTGFSSTGFFERDRYGIPGIPGGLDADTQRAFIFIHELSHATGRFTHPGQGDPRDFDEPPIPNEDLNKLIWETCFK